MLVFPELEKAAINPMRTAMRILGATKMMIFRPSRRTISRITQCIFLIGVHSLAQAGIINFSGQLDVVELDTGGAVYSGVAIGSVFSGDIDDVTFNGSINDGTTLTAFSCCIAAGGLSITNNEILNAGDAALLNSLGNTNFVAGDQVDLIDLEGDVMTSGGGRIEIGLSYILDPLSFSDESLENYPPDPGDILISLFFIFEADSQDQDIYSAFGALDVLDPDTDGDGDPDATDPDDDNDGIGDALDTDPLNGNNFCSGSDPQTVAFQQVVSGDLSCAAQVSISVVPLTTVLASGDLRLIAPTVTFQSGFAVAGALTVISAHPCPACSP